MWTYDQDACKYAEQLREDLEYRREWCDKTGPRFPLPIIRNFGNQNRVSLQGRHHEVIEFEGDKAVGASGFEPPASGSGTGVSKNLKSCRCRTYKHGCPKNPAAIASQWVPQLWAGRASAVRLRLLGSLILDSAHPNFAFASFRGCL